jgi:glucose/arabinose dehydrogenase
MKRWQGLLLGAIAVLGLAAAGGAYWWQRSRTLLTAEFEVPTANVSQPARLQLLTLAVGLEQPTDIQFIPGGGTRAVVLEQAGRARLMDFGPVLRGGPPIDARTAPLVLDLWVRPMGEMGLLGLAFHPKYRERGTFYVYYAPWVHDTLVSRIAEFSLPWDELGQRVATEKRVLLEFEQKFIMHQGGQVAFGPDGKLYVGVGDGSTADDPDGNSQNLGSLHGKLLRLDPDGTNLVPADNPFVQRAGARPEVWAFGLRNPWRFYFDDAGHAVVGDVGQEGREEIDMVTAGANMGWNVRQGRICGGKGKECSMDGMVEPIHDYDRTVGACVTGGFEGRGSRVPEIAGKYVFADFVRGRIWSMKLPPTPPVPGAPSVPMEPELLGEWPRLFSSFARDAAGDLYVADVALGEVLALMPVAK